MPREEPEIIDERWVEFYGDTILAVLAKIDGKLQVLVPVRPVCDVLGVDWNGQYQRIRRDDVLGSTMCEIHTVARDGKRRKMAALPLEYLHGWLFGISASQVKEEFRDKITLYRRECFQALSTAFQADLVLPDKEAPPATGTGMTLAQVRDLGLAIAQMAEQQLALEGRVDETHALATQAHGRLDKAAEVIGALQRRVGTVENRLSPGTAITEDQAAEVSNRVKALAHLLSGKEKGKNHYQGVFGELYRRFGVTSYTHIPQGQYAEVLAFLEEWRQSVAGEPAISPIEPQE
jgi:hypothetical protein